MSRIREEYLDAAASASALLSEPAVAGAWAEDSALPRLTVGGLAAHLAWQVTVIIEVLDAPEPDDPVLPILEYYGRVGWIGADLDAPVNVRIRTGSETEAAAGPAGIVERVVRAETNLRNALPALPPRRVRLPAWGAWSLTLDDLLLTRLMELVVHSDDLAVSVGLPTPPLPPSVVETVVDLLSRLAVRRHGPVNVLRALSRSERAPETIAAF